MKKEQELKTIYKEAFSQVHASTKLKGKVMNMTDKNNKAISRRMKTMVAGFAGLILCLGGITTYAYMNPALVTDFFGKNITPEISSELYQNVDSSITVGDHIFTFEGYIYTPEINTGYIAVKVTRKDGSVPEISFANNELHFTDADNNPVVIDSTIFDYTYKIDDTKYAVIDNGEIRRDYTHIEEQENGTYIFYKFFHESGIDNIKDLQFYVIPTDEIKPLCEERNYVYSEEIEQAIFDNYKSIPLSLDSSKESIVSFEKDGNLIKLSRLELKLDETDTNHLVHDLVLIEADGNRIDIIKNDNIIPVDDQWAGYSQRTNEDGTRELYFTLGKIIDPKNVKIELNGEVIN